MQYQVFEGNAVVNTIEATPEFMEQAYPAGNYAALPPPPPQPNPVPSSVTMRQARLALLAVGLLDDVEAAVAAAGRAAQIEWEYATDVQRTHPLIAAVQAAQGMSNADVDQLFIAAAEL